MTEAMLKAWIDVNLKPLLNHAMKVMPLSTLGSALLGYGVSCAKSGGMTEEAIRARLEAALEENSD